VSPTHTTTLPANTILYSNDFLVLRVIQQNFGRRPLVWGLTAAGSTFGLDRFLVQRALGINLMPVPADSTDLRYDFRRMMGVPLDLPMTERLLMETYRYARLLEEPRRELESTANGIASTLGLPFTQMAYAMEQRGDTAKTIRFLEGAAKLSGNPAVTAALNALKQVAPPPPPRSP